MNKLFAYVALVVVLGLVFVGIGTAVNSSRQSEPPKVVVQVYSFTVASDVGVANITVTNETTQSTIVLIAANLPATFNFKTKEVLTFTVKPKQGYIFNAWVFDDGTFRNANPLTVSQDRSFSMTARFLQK